MAMSKEKLDFDNKNLVFMVWEKLVHQNFVIPAAFVNELTF